MFPAHDVSTTLQPAGSRGAPVTRCSVASLCGGVDILPLKHSVGNPSDAAPHCRTSIAASPWMPSHGVRHMHTCPQCSARVGTSRPSPRKAHHVRSGKTIRGKAGQ